MPSTAWPIWLALAGLSTRQLQRTLKQTTGFSPHDLLKVLRIQQSFKRHYLDLYADQSHYIHAFRTATGYTPARYLKKFGVCDLDNTRAPSTSYTARLSTPKECPMAKSNAIGWFDIYVSRLDRAVAFYESVLQTHLEPLGDPTGETHMMGFPTDMGRYGAGGALVKSAHARPGQVEPWCTSVS